MANTLETLVIDYFTRHDLPFPEVVDVISEVQGTNNTRGTA